MGFGCEPGAANGTRDGGPTDAAPTTCESRVTGVCISSVGQQARRLGEYGVWTPADLGAPASAGSQPIGRRTVGDYELDCERVGERSGLARCRCVGVTNTDGTVARLSASGAIECGAPAPMASHPQDAVVRVVLDARRDWLPNLERTELAGLKHICSGTLIAPRVAMTAQHCVNAVDLETEAFSTNPRDVLLPAEVRVCVGETVATSLASLRSGAHEQRCFAVSRVVLPPNTYGAAAHRDIALLVLTTAVESVAPFPLDSRPLAIGDPVSHIGFGIDPTTGYPALRRKRIGSSVIHRLVYGDWEDMARTYPSPRTCQGDSGSPLLRGSLDDPPRVVGVLSRAYSHCLSGVRPRSTRRVPR